MALLRRWWDRLTWNVPVDHCWRCWRPYAHQVVVLTFSDRFGYIPPRKALMEVCSKCGSTGCVVRELQPQPEPGGWRGVNEPWSVGV